MMFGIKHLKERVNSIWESVHTLRGDVLKLQQGKADKPILSEYGFPWRPGLQSQMDALNEQHQRLLDHLKLAEVKVEMHWKLEKKG